MNYIQKIYIKTNKNYEKTSIYFYWSFGDVLLLSKRKDKRLLLYRGVALCEYRKIPSVQNKIRKKVYNST